MRQIVTRHANLMEFTPELTVCILLRRPQVTVSCPSWFQVSFHQLT